MRGKSPWGPRKGPKIFFEDLFFEKSKYDPDYGQTWTLDPAVKPFGSTVNKEAGKVVETSEEKDGEFPREKDEEFPREYWTFYPVYLNP